MVGLHHYIFSLQLTRDDTNGVGYNELEVHLKVAKANHTNILQLKGALFEA